MERKSSSNLGKRLRFDEEEKDYRFKILLPNGTSVNLNLKRTVDDDMSLKEFIDRIRKEYDRSVGIEVVKGRRKIVWRDPSICLEDLTGVKMPKTIPLMCYPPDKCHILRLHDGVKDSSDTFENMWDLTPGTDILMELPQEYTFETALADLIDNSLQAVWSNARDERKLVSVSIGEDEISILDTGPGMDDSDKNSLVKWGKMGASLHRSAKRLAIGGKPPYLTPFFGMFGYGGAIASMHLGRDASVFSKTKNSKKVYRLDLSREALINSREKTWKTGGSIRNPLEDEISASPHGSFTKVEISKLKVKLLDINQLKCRLKDIYFPYIQCDEMLGTGRTTTPIQFQVNGDDLADLTGGEVAITNMHSCHGPDFVLQLHLLYQDASTVTSSREPQKAHARLKCVYYPIVKGKESINTILESLRVDGDTVAETFDTFCRASIRRLGRLLPDARWGRLPFMESRHRKGDRAQVLKRCCMRVKCFIDTDAGFSPTPSKTDLAHRHPCTVALKNFGNRTLEKDIDVSVEIFRGGKTLSISQLEKEYEDWVFEMHDKYDEESVCGEDDPIVVVLNPHNKKGLGISSNVVRVHKVIKRNGNTWKSGQHIKICKGAVGCHKNNLYAALEYIVLEGLEEDVCGEARLICRPLHVPVEKGCVIEIDDMNTTSLDIRGSKSFPISVIDSGKCKVMEPAELKKQLEKLDQNSPSTIDILRSKDCHQLAIEEALPIDGTVSAGSFSLKKVVAVLRPAFFDPGSSFRSLDQKSIIKADLEMSMEVTYLGEDYDPQEEHIYAERSKPSVHGGIQGLYIFTVGSRNTKHFQKSGIYRFLFTVICEDSGCLKCEKRLIVLPDTRVDQWKHLSDEKCRTYHVRVGSCSPPVSIACVDIYGNHMPFISSPGVLVKVESTNCVMGHSRRMKVNLSSNRLILNISDIWIESSNLDSIRPHYKASLVISSQDELYCVRIPCQVTPGVVFFVTDLCMELEKPLLPGSVIKQLVLELKDRFGNHIERGVEVSIHVEGLGFQDQKGSTREVDDKGYIDLSGVLKVKAGYGNLVSVFLNIGVESYYKKEFQVEQRKLRIVSTVPEYCAAGSHLEDVVFEVVDSVGMVDEGIHDSKFGKHTLRITSELPGIHDSLQYSFIHGRCTVPFIPIPEKEGICFIVAVHSNHPELCTNVEVHVVRTPQWQKESGYKAIEPPQCSDGGMLLLQDKAVCIVNDAQELDNDVLRAASRIEEHEKKLKLLGEKKESLEQQILDLKESVEPEELNLLDYFKMVRRIEGKDNTAASVICNMLEFSMSQRQEDECMQDIIGVVALLATVSTYDLSRILAEYLREDNMLAVVCKSYATACTLEKYKEQGDIDHSDALHAIAAELGKSIDGRFDVIYLEGIRPYAGKIEDGPQRRLVLADPLLPTGDIPTGFIGYAVNIIKLDARFICTRTIGGHGLRETLFYHLFGELQVYKTRKCMKKACSSIKHGAVSLDGGILRGNGVFSYGVGYVIIHY
ncbi:hypothetical protein AQUCO_09100023v1 [Aquilegia coerulea]|uniref:Uncharacterized protein n=1 Tax=Aquilegia coerulea TaxID=218851 RepID=A0A2G5C5H5_AQUCA|nr:hypothetical protein AQUCO_09100023v1 [Aquilegia coerulea]